MRIKQVTYYEIDYHDVDKLVHEHFGIGHTGNKWHPAYEFVAVEECGNDSSHSFGGVNAGPLDGETDYQAESVKSFLEDGTPKHLSNFDVLCLLCRKGLIPPGDYLVNVCW